MIVVSRQQKAHAVLFSLKKGLLACFLWNHFCQVVSSKKPSRNHIYKV
jgi:hypothetical protein